MPLSEYSGLANASLDHIWEHLVDKVRHPDRYLKGITDILILEEGPGNRVIRRMTINFPGKPPMTVLEEITWNEADHLVDFKILEHPSHTGNVINRIDKHEDGTLWLTYRMDWKFKGEGPDPMEGMNIKGAVDSSLDSIYKSIA